MRQFNLLKVRSKLTLADDSKLVGTGEKIQRLVLTKQNVNCMEKIQKTLKCIDLKDDLQLIDKYGKLYRKGRFLTIILPFHVE